VEGDIRDVPTALGLSAYRIVQEALTNVVKHAGRAAHVEVMVRRTRHELVLEITDDGASVASKTSIMPGGNGLIGMGERVALFGGRLWTGPRRGGGFAVRAEIPLDAQR
jgi:signal transduction histidine kinase